MARTIKFLTVLFLYLASQVSLAIASSECMEGERPVLETQIELQNLKLTLKPKLLGVWPLPRYAGDNIHSLVNVYVYYEHYVGSGPRFLIYYDYRANQGVGLPYSFQRATLEFESKNALEDITKDYQWGNCFSAGASIFPGQYFSEKFPLDESGSPSSKYLLRIWGSQN